jgi:hypothetical protein
VNSQLLRYVGARLPMYFSGFLIRYLPVANFDMITEVSFLLDIDLVVAC